MKGKRNLKVGDAGVEAGRGRHSRDLGDVNGVYQGLSGSRWPEGSTFPDPVPVDCHFPTTPFFCP